MFAPVYRRLAVALFACAIAAPSAQALIAMDAKSVDAALVYGMKNQREHLSGFLGPNWIENPETGALLNVYSPFMLLATKAAAAKLSRKPTLSDLQSARKKFAKDVAFYRDVNNRPKVKFAVSLYGATPSFAKTYSAHIEGEGRGQSFLLKPDREIRDQIADAIDGGLTNGQYEAINAYYFKLNDLLNMDTFTLVLESPEAPTIRFRIDPNHLY